MQNLDNLKEFTKEKVEVKIDKLEGFLKQYELEKIHIDLLEKISLLIIGAFGLIAAVAWDQVLKTIVTNLFANTGSDIQKVIYAIVVTILTAVISIIANKIFQNRKKKSTRKDITETLRDLVS
jgi:TRAP-type C4-dicarboxylate transport system permease small subunit